MSFVFDTRPAGEFIPTMYTAGFPVQTARRLTEVTLSANSTPAGKYTLTYDSTGGTIFYHSLLQAVTRSDDATPPTSLPSIGLTTYGTIDTFTPETLSVGLYPLRWLNWVGDFNGDGKADLAVWISGSTGNVLKIYIANDQGGFNDPYIASTNLYADDSGPWFWFGDFNGDGRTDIAGRLPTDTEHIYMHLSQVDTYGTFTGFTVTQWHATPGSATGTVPTAWVGDFNGDGKTDIISYENGTTIVKHSSTHPPANLLHTVMNGIGATTTIAYAPSSVYANTLLPFVLQTVSSTTVDDGNGVSSTTNYTYGQGLHIHADREFYGFGYAKATNPVGTTSETWFNQRVNEDVPNKYKGLPQRQVTKDSAGATYTETNYAYGSWVAFQASANPFVGSVFPYLFQKDDDVYDGTGTYRRSRTSLDYDAYGNPSAKVVKECTAQDCSSVADERYEYSNYVYSTSAWIMNRPHTTYVAGMINGTPTIFAQTYYAYDGGARFYDNLNHTATFTRGNMTSKEDWNDHGANPLTTYTYNTYGNQTSVTDPNNRTTTYTYDTAAYTYVAKVTNALSHMVDTTWDYRFGKSLIKTAPYVQGDTAPYTSYTYDGFGRPVTVVRPGDTPSPATVSYAYEGFGTVGVQRVTTFLKDGSPNGLWSETYFDGLGRTVAVRKESTSANPVVIHTVYNNIGTVSVQYLPCFAQNDATLACQGGVYVPYTAFAYDPIGRIAISEFHGDPVARTSYYYDKGRTTIIDAGGHVKDEVKDIHGRLVTVHEYSGVYSHDVYPNNYTLYATTDYTYDVLNNLTTVKDNPQNNTRNTTAMTYSSLSRKTAMWDPDMGHWTYGYDPNGNLTSQTDAKGQTLTFDYDQLNRVRHKYYPGGGTITYTYDSCAANPAYCRGRLSSTTDLSGSTSFAYDMRGRTQTTTKTITGAPANPYLTQYAYDSLDRTISVFYPAPSNLTVNYTYDSAGNLSQVWETGAIHATYDNYTALGQTGRVRYRDPNTPSATTTYTYDTTNARLDRMITVNQSQTLQDFTYDYFTEGTISHITDGVSPYRNSQTFGYDDLHRLTSATGGYGNLAFTYNEIGNIMSKTGFGNYVYPTPGSPRPHAPTTAGGYGFTYDNNGNMLTGMGRTITWTYDNKPASINSASFTYDYSGRRVRKASTSTTYYIDPVLEYTGGAYTSYIFANGKRIAKKIGTTPSYYHTDHLNSTSIETDQNGNKTFEACYKPYGETWYQSGTEKYKFTGQEEDAEVSLYNYGARHYDPLFARFVSPDSIVPDPADPQTLNRYSYCGNNPVMYVDPSGHIFEPFSAAAIIGAVVGALSSGISSGWDPGAMALGAGIGWASGGIANGVSSAVASQITMVQVVEQGVNVTVSSIPSITTNVSVCYAAAGAAGGAVGGATAGGLSAAAYGGNVGESMLRGAGLGALGGAAFGALGKPDAPWKVLAYGAAGGGLSMLTGGGFENGFAIGAGLAGLAYGYNKLFGMPLDGRTATEAAALERPEKPAYYLNPANFRFSAFGMAGRIGLLGEGHPSMQYAAQNSPFLQQGSWFHDLAVDLLPTALGYVALGPTIPPAIAVTLGGGMAYYAPITAPIACALDADR